MAIRVPVYIQLSYTYIIVHVYIHIYIYIYMSYCSDDNTGPHTGFLGQTPTCGDRRQG